MGNCCGKQESDAFSQPGRVLGSASSPSSTTPLNRAQQQKPTAAVPRKVGGPPRALGGTAGAAAGGGGDQSHSHEGARARAAEAAEARAKAASKGGKLQSQLSAQKKQTRENTLRDASGQAVRQRDMDEAAQARAWD